MRREKTHLAALIFLFGMVAVLSTSLRAEQEPAWEPDYAFRRAVTVPANQTWRDSGIASVQYRMGEWPSAETAGRILVTDARGKPAAAKVLFASPRCSCSVLFRARPGTNYFLYFGPGESAKVGPDLEVTRGLVLETRKRPSGRCNSWRDMTHLLADARQVQGAAPVPNIFLGHNPFGDSKGYISIFQGFIRIPRDGVWTFCTVSSDASFFLVDGKEVVSWPGRHPPNAGLWGQKKGTIELKAGLYPIAYYQECRGNTPIAELAWIPPGTDRPKLVPPSAFPGFLQARAGPLQRRDSRPAADFDFRPQGIARAGSAYLYAATFSALIKPGFRVSWDFGDGLEAEGSPVHHVFIGKDLFRVRMVLRREGDEEPLDEFIQNVDTAVLLPHWRAPQKPEFFLDLLKGYDFQSLSSARLTALLSVFRDFGTWADQVLVLEALTEREDGGSGRDRLYNGIALGELCLALGDPAKALEAFRMVEERTKGTYWEARVRVGTLRSAFATGELDPSEALKSLEETASRVKKESPDTARKALNAAGDVRLAGGEWGLALGFYRRGHALRTGKEAGSNAFVRKGAFSSKVLALIEEKKYEKARQKIWEWEEEYPEEKVEGYSADLRTRSHLLEGDYEKTVGAADAFLRLDRTTHFTAPVLYLKGTALWGLKRNEEAEAALRRIVKSFPETPERKKAERLLRRLKGKKSGDEEK